MNDMSREVSCYLTPSRHDPMAELTRRPAYCPGQATSYFRLRRVRMHFFHEGFATPAKTVRFLRPYNREPSAIQWG